MNWMQRFFFTRTLGLLTIPLALVLVLWLWAPSARAALLTQTLTSSVTDLTSPTATLTLARFDPSLGDLQSVNLSYHVSGSGSSSLTVLCSPGETCDRFQRYTLTVGIQPFTLGTIQLQGQSTNGGGAVRCFAQGRDQTCTQPVSANFGGGDFAADAATLDLFDDPGTLSFGFSVIDRLNVSGVRLSADVEVIYTYVERQAVPEPGALSLAGLGVIGLVAARRRRRAGAAVSHIA